MIQNVKANDNVPLQDKPRFSIVGLSPTLIKHVKTSGDFTGKRAKTLAQPDPTKVVPTVSRGMAVFEGLSEGGIFYLGGPGARPLVIDGVFSKNCTPTFKIIAMDDPAIDVGTPVELRPWPGTFPVRLGANECIMATSTGASGVPEIGLVVRLDGTKIV